MRVIVILLLVCSAALPAACGGNTVWVSDQWSNGSSGQRQWVSGGYVTQPVVTVVQQPTQQVIVVPSRTPAPVWVDGGWVWSANQWVWREGYWSVAPSCPPQPVSQPQPVYAQPVYAQPVYVQPVVYQPVYTRPRVSIALGIGVGYWLGHGFSHHHSCH